MAHAPVSGARWRASDAYWYAASKNAHLNGVRRNRVTSPVTNFAHQSGIYILYSDHTPIYIGQANKSLFARLQTHCLTDDLCGRWDCFTWFGFRSVIGGGTPLQPLRGSA
jgi:hypothetical protein